MDRAQSDLVVRAIKIVTMEMADQINLHPIRCLTNITETHAALIAIGLQVGFELAIRDLSAAGRIVDAAETLGPTVGDAAEQRDEILDLLALASHGRHEHADGPVH